MVCLSAHGWWPWLKTTVSWEVRFSIRKWIGSGTWDYAVAQKILPMINGYGETYKIFLNNLLKTCDKNNMPVCNRIIQDIIKKGDLNMAYYQFFAK